VSYNFDINEINETFSTIGGMQSRDAFSTHANLTYRTLELPKILVQFDSVEKPVDIQGAEKDEDMVNPFNEGLKALQGALFNVTVNPHGEVTGISGYEEFEKKFTTLYDAAEATDKDIPKQVFPVRPVIKEAFFLDIFENISNTLGGRSVAVDSTWESMVAEEIGTERDIKNIFRLDKIENGIAYISSNNDQVEKVIKYHDMTMVLRGTMQGEYELDAATGILLKGKRCLNISGSTKLMHGTDFAMTIKKTITINGKRINL
jgi:hypothetical protein